jgi:hypothetical protein
MNLLLVISSLLPFAFAAPAKRGGAPTVVIPSPAATIVGSSALSVDTFNGIPFAQPPVGSLRLKPPQPLTAPLGTVSATGIPQACPQFFFSDATSGFPESILGDLLDTPLFQTVTNAGEDCLTINVMRPTGTTSSSKLPVLFWIFGGGFELGSTEMYDGAGLVADSITDGQPIVFVAVNYRVGGFGFLPGAEILADGSANLGLLDQRLGLQWVADNIAAFVETQQKSPFGVNQLDPFPFSIKWPCMMETSITKVNHFSAEQLWILGVSFQRIQWIVPRDRWCMTPLSRLLDVLVLRQLWTAFEGWIMRLS